MSGRKLLSYCLIFMLMFQVITVVSTPCYQTVQGTPELNGEVLTITAKPVSTKDFAEEWKDFRLRYALVYALAFAVVLLK